MGDGPPGSGGPSYRVAIQLSSGARQLASVLGR